MKKKMAGFLAILFAVTGALGGCSAIGGSAIDDTVEAVNVDGVSIPLGEVNFYLRYQQASMQNAYGAYFGEDFMNQDLMGLGRTYGETVRDTTVDTLTEYYLVEAHAEELGVSLSEEEKTAASDAAKAFIADNKKSALTAMSADEAAVTHVLELMALQSKVYADRAGTIDTEVDDEEAAQKRISYVRNSTAGITDDDGNEVELTEEELAEKKSVMEDILSEAKESQDLSAAAEAHELQASSITYGKDDTLFGEDVKNAADKLEDGEFSEVIEADNAYYIVYMESTFDEEATENERQNILQTRRQEAYDNWYTPLKEAAEITNNDAALDTLKFDRIYQALIEESSDTDTGTESDAEADQDTAPEDDEAETGTEE